VRKVTVAGAHIGRVFWAI